MIGEKLSTVGRDIARGNGQRAFRRHTDRCRWRELAVKMRCGSSRHQNIDEAAAFSTHVQETRSEIMLYGR
jgi:hypothetical protein